MTESQPIRIIDPEHAPERDPGETRGRPSKWPFEDLQVGGCFEVPEDKVQSVRQLCSARNSKERDKEPLHGPGFKVWSVGQAKDGKWYCWRDQ